MSHSHKIFRIHGLIAVVMTLSVLGVMAGDKTPDKPTPNATPARIQTSTMMALENTLNQSIQLSHQAAISELLAPEKIAIAALTPEASAAKALFDKLEQENKLIPALNNGSLQDLPVAIPLDKNSNTYLAIKKAVFKTTHVELEVYARLIVGDEELYFGSKNVRYVMNEGLSGTVNLALLGTQEISNAQYLLQFNGGTAASNPGNTITQLKINCGSFQGLVLKGKIDFNKDTFIALDNKGYPVTTANTTVSSPIDFQTASLSQLYVPLKNTIAFTLKKSQAVMGFSLKEAFIDLTEVTTPSSLSSLLGSFLAPNNTSTRNQWTGLYAEKTTVYLPAYFYPVTNKDPNPFRPSYESTALVMDASGIYMTSSKTNVAKWDKMGGSPMTVDQIQFTLKGNSYVSLSVKGKIGVVLAKSPFKDKSDKSYNFDNLGEAEYIKYKGNLDDKSENFALKVEPQTSMNFMGAKSTLRPDSKVEFAQDTPNYRSTTATVDSLGSFSKSGATDVQTIYTPGVHTFQARLVTPKLSMRYIIGKGLGDKTITHDTVSNTDKLLTLGVVLVENLQVGYSFLSKKPIFSFTRMGYEEMGKIPVFKKVGLRKFMATYDEIEKMCEFNFAMYGNVGATTDTASSNNADTTSKVMILVDLSLNFAMEVTDDKTEASFDSFGLNELRITGSVAGFNVTGSLDFVTDAADENEYGIACVGSLTAECRIKGVTKLTTPAGSDDPAKITISWIVGEKKEAGKKFGYVYFDGLFNFGEVGPLIGASGVRLNGFGFGVSVNMIQTDEIGTRNSLTGRKFIPKQKAGGFLLAVTFIDIKKTERGYLGVYAEFEKGGGYNGFRKLSIYGSWEIARDNTSMSELSVQDAISKASATQATNAKLPPAKTYTQQVNNAVKLLDVPLDDKFAILKFSLDFDCTTDDFIMEGNVYGFMHFNLNQDDGSYVRGAADDEGLGYLGMIAFKAVIKNGAVAGNKNTKNEEKVDYKNSKGYFWIGRPDEPLAIEAMINVGRVETPKYLKFGATLFMVGGNVALPSNRVKYYSTVENAKNQINAQLAARHDDPIHWDLSPSVMQEGNGYFAFGFSIGGAVDLGTPESWKVGVYFNASFGFGMAMNYSQVMSCNKTHFLGSAIVHGSGELGIRINVSQKQMKFAIIKGSFAIGGVGDGKNSYGAGMFEYSILGGIVEGKAFGKFGAPFCMNPMQYDVNSRVSLVDRLSPDAPLFKIQPDTYAEYTGEIFMNEMIIVKINPSIAVYEKCNIVLDQKDTLINVAVVANYTLYRNGVVFNNIQRWKGKRKDRQDDEIRFVGKAFEPIVLRNPKKPKGLWWKANIHAPGNYQLKMTLIITDDNNIQFGEGDRNWDKIGDFEQKLNFTFKVSNKFQQFLLSNGQSEINADHYYYVRNP